MNDKRLQRTLLVGLGERGAQTADLLLSKLAGENDELRMMNDESESEQAEPLHRSSFIIHPFVQGLAVVGAEMPLKNIRVSLLISPGSAFETWQADFARQVGLALRLISQLQRLPHLAQQRVMLYHPEEIHLIIVADLAEGWVQPALPQLAAVLSQMVYQTLHCQASLTGVMLDVPPAEAGLLEGLSPILNEGLAGQLPRHDFDRGCFLAGLTNEVGLIIGGVDRLIEYTACFLLFLMRETPGDGLNWAETGPAGWGASLASFGMATVSWPGQNLVDLLSRRWARAMLTELTAAPEAKWPSLDLAQQARQAVQGWFIGQKLAPPLLLETVATVMPSPPHHLADLTPDLPWPWLFVETQGQVETAARRWQADGLTIATDRLKARLTELKNAWQEQAVTWVGRQVGQGRTGAVLLAQSYLAAVSELLHAFVEGVEQKQEEAEVDLSHLDQQLGQAAQALLDEVTLFPGSPLVMLLRWGPSPHHWLQYWADCRRAQATARRFAHLSRDRLLAWQSLWFYEELLVFYRELVREWEPIRQRWEQSCRQVAQAHRATELADMSDQLTGILAASAGPWAESWVMRLYQEAVEPQADTVWEQVGSLNDWVAAGLEAGEIEQRLLTCARQALWPVVTMPADQALCRQFVDKQAQADWLAGLVEQARPFWPYDETMLTDRSRTQTRLSTWLLLPGAEASPLASLAQDRSDPPRLIVSHNSEEISVITMRPIDEYPQNEPDEWQIAKG